MLFLVVVMDFFFLPRSNFSVSAGIIPCVIQINTKFGNFVGLYFPHYLQHFTTKLCNFTNFNMLFLVVVMDFFFLPRSNFSVSAGIIPCVIQINTKFGNFVGLYFPHYLQHFTTKLCNFTNFNMLFLVVVMDFVLLA